jgi:hypothetical protein
LRKGCFGTLFVFLHAGMRRAFIGVFAVPRIGQKRAEIHIGAAFLDLRFARRA